MLLKTIELDEKQTISNVREFFSKELPIIKAQARVSFISLKSPVIDGMPKSSNTGNNVETKLTNHMQSKQWLEEIVEVIRSMPEKPRMFLDYRYLQSLQWLEIEQRTGYSTRRGEQLVNQGFLMFANAFIDIYDFRVWQ